MVLGALAGLLIGATAAYALTRMPLIVRLLTLALAAALLYLAYGGIDGTNRTAWSIGLMSAIAGLLVMTLWLHRQDA